jgi:hypothetical protein
MIDDPDEGLELQEDFRSVLRQSLSTVQAGGETLSAEDVAAKLGLSW